MDVAANAPYVWLEFRAGADSSTLQWRTATGAPPGCGAGSGLFLALAFLAQPQAAPSDTKHNRREIYQQGTIRGTEVASVQETVRHDLADLSPVRGQVRSCVALLLLATAAFAWAYWPTLVSVVRRWSLDPQYTHGYVVPLFAALVLWLRRDWFPDEADVAPSWWGVPLLLLASVCRLAGALYSFEWLEGGSILFALAGLVWLTMGWRVLRWGLPAAVLLVFVLPWPWQFDQVLTHPLRRIATVCSTWALQLLGVPALARGNVIVVNDMEIGVVEACSGLGMLMTFFALSTAVAFSVSGSRFDKAVLFLSAVPIGVLMNVCRITVTVFLYQYASAKVAQVVFHDVAGWVMMPAAVAVLWMEMLVLGWVWIPMEKGKPVPLVLRRAGLGPPQPPPSSMADTRPVNEIKPLELKPDLLLQEMPDVAS